MNLELSVNFDFEKLANQTNKITDDYIEEFVADVETGTKETIDSGRLKPLEQSTIKWRRSKGYPTSPPLKASGKMYNSIKAKKDSLSLLQYGYWHHSGEVKNTPQRKFISTRAKKKLKIDKKFVESLNKALSSNKVVVSL